MRRPAKSNLQHRGVWTSAPPHDKAAAFAAGVEEVEEVLVLGGTELLLATSSVDHIAPAGGQLVAFSNLSR